MNETEPIKRVLYIEDDANDVFFMRRAFRKLGLSETLAVAGDGDEGVAYLGGAGTFADREAYPLPDIVLLDLKMPGRSGLEVLTWIRAQPTLASLKVVMFTSSTQRSDLAYCATHGADAYVVKPSRADLADLVVAKVLAAPVVTIAGRRQLDFPDNLLLNAAPETRG